MSFSSSSSHNSSASHLPSLSHTPSSRIPSSRIPSSTTLVWTAGDAAYDTPLPRHDAPHNAGAAHHARHDDAASIFRGIIETLHELVAEEVPTENVFSVACLRLLIGETKFIHQAPPYLEKFKLWLAIFNEDIVIQYHDEDMKEVIRIMQTFVNQNEGLRHASGGPRIQRTISVAPSEPLAHQSSKGGFVSLQCRFCLRLLCITSIIFCMKNPDSFRDRLIWTILRSKTPHGNIHREKIY